MFRKMMFSIIAAAFVVTLSSEIANAQANPSDSETNKWKQQGPCRDPWVSKAVYEYKGRTAAGVGDFQECSPALYANGSWHSYAELAQAVRNNLGGLNSGGITFAMDAPVNQTAKLKTLVNGTEIGSAQVRLIGHDGASLVSHDGGGIVSHDGGGIVASGGGNLRLLSTATEKRINLGKSVLIIKKK
jgi:hypothetical protein